MLRNLIAKRIKDLIAAQISSLREFDRGAN
jgi:hypothetical protein